MGFKLTKQLTALICVCASLLLYFTDPFALGSAAGKVIAVGILMVALWVTEALPMPAVALLPLVLFPLLRVNTIADTASSYANPVIFLFMGGFMLGLAIEKWNLHKRIALNIVRYTGTSGDRIILGFIIATGLISMWLSNTATTMMMFPIALSVVKVLENNAANHKGITNFSLSLMIAIALSANFGGIATLIGTPPNVAYAAYINKQFDITISFARWLFLCLPISLLLFLFLYVVMVKWLYPNHMKSDAATKDLIATEIAKLGKYSVAEKRVMVIFGITALLWISKDLLNQYAGLNLDDNMIAIMGALALFITPAGDSINTLLAWKDTQRMAWGILILFGGGIALAGALEKAGLIEQLGQWFAQYNFHPLLIIFLVALFSLFISEVMSNVAQVIVFAPVVSSLAVAIGMHPLQLGIPMALAASCAGMLPMGTPPNAIAFSSGYIGIKDMMKVGFFMNIISIILITLFSWLLLPIIMGI